MREVEHPTEELLVALFEEELSAAEVERLLAHLDICETCGQRVELIEPAFARHRRCRELIEAHLPRAPRPWVDIYFAMERADRGPRIVPTGKTRRGIARPAWAGALAAGIVAATLLFWPHSGAELRADVLLERAIGSTAHRSPRAQIRIRTPKTSFLRPAVLRGNTETVPESWHLSAKFAAAHYDWSDPLSAAAFREWRGTLPRPTGDVVAGAGQYTIRERQDGGVLMEASITLDAIHMLPLSARFVFSAEDWVEISKAPESVEEPGQVAAIPGDTRQSAPELPQERSLVERELLTMLAIDRLNAGAGEPIDVEVEPDGRIVVTPYRLGQPQESMLRASLEGIERVTVRAQEEAQEAAAVVAGDEPAIDASNAIASRAHLLTQMAGRFPAEAEAAFSPALRKELHQMQARHARQLESDIDTLCQALARSRPVRFGPANGPAETGGVQALAAAAVAVNRMVTSLYAGGTAGEAAWRGLPEEVARLRRLAHQYAREIPQ